MTTTRRRVILDTDIGSNVDDALALAVLLGSPEAELVGCTTVYGDTLVRARIAARLLRLAGRRAAVVPGERETLAGRPVWWAGHEDTLLPGLEAESVDDAVAAPEFLAERVAAAPGQVDVVAIGPLTDIARAIQIDPAFPRRVRHLWIMGGRFDGGAPEHNFASDPEAARVVFASRTPTTVTGLEVTSTVRFGAAEAAAVAAGGELGRAPAAQMRQWWRFKNADATPPHDAIALLAMLTPEVFTFSAYGSIAVAADGAARFTPQREPGSGSARLVTAVDVAAVTAQIIRRVLAAAPEHRRERLP